MKKLWPVAFTALSLVAFGAPLLVGARSADSIRDFVHVANTYQVMSNLTYRTVSNWDAKLDNLKAYTSIRAFFFSTHGLPTFTAEEAARLSVAR